MLRDSYNRAAKDLRISVTDRCNFRCTCCMPLDKYVWIERQQILSYEEIVRLARLFVELGVEKIRLTGGEPLLRRDLERLVAGLAALPGLNDLCLTTNGALLGEKAAALRDAGLRRINVSLESLDPEKFRRITQRGELERVLEGLAVAKSAGLAPIKLNAVIERGVNDDEILGLVEFARREGFAIRFIEYMDVGNVNGWQPEKVVPAREILAAVRARYPLREASRDDGSRRGAPAVDYEFADGGGEVGAIASVTEPFCGDCTRVRLTAEGELITCLFAETGRDLKALLRAGAPDQELKQAIVDTWTRRADRYSEQRLVAIQSGAAYQPTDRKKIEMITLGG
jgi:cyclic pyranopterin phosphate synthase